MDARINIPQIIALFERPSFSLSRTYAKTRSIYPTLFDEMVKLRGMSNDVRYFHMTIQPAITRDVNVRNQTSQASIASSCPCFDCSCPCDYRPQDVSNACQTQALKDDLRADVWQFSHRFLFFFFGLMVIKTWCGDPTQLLNRFMYQFAVPFNAFHHISFHVVGPRVRFFPAG